MIRSEQTDQKARALARILGALADENRIKIVLYLGGGSKCVCELVDALGIPQNLVSHHLRVLRDRGLVSYERRGRWIYYSLRRQAMRELAVNIGRIHSVKKSRPSSDRCG